MMTPDRSSADAERLREMREELRDNHDLHLSLLDHYNSFRFTGGEIPAKPWNVVAVTSFLLQPTTGTGISTKDVERYRQLSQAIADLGQEVATEKGPRSLRCRHAIAARFANVSAEVLSLEETLELSLSKQLAPGSGRS